MNNNGFSDINPRIDETKDPKTNKHDRMKLFGRKLLFYMGIPSKNILEEETINFKGKRYRVDLVGYPTGKDYPNSLAIAIECGDNKAEKIEALRNTFSLVLILPYNEFDIVNTPEIKTIQKITKDLEQQTISNYHYLQEIKRTEKEFQDFKDSFDKRLAQECDNINKNISTEITSRLQNIDTKIQKYETDLKHLRDFKEWCTKFSNI